MITIGIDPGKTGAIAVDFYGKVHFDKMPENRYEIIDYFLQLSQNGEGDIVAYIEQLHAGSVVQGPRKSAKTIWSQAANYSDIMCALYASDIKTIEVSPAKWMGKLQGTRPKEYAARKSWLHEKAKRLYPELKSPKYAADALCILHVSQLK